MREEPLRERARGRWRGILPQLGVPGNFLDGKHHPCPMCGGRDRARFDDKDGRGTWICSQCGAGDGITLVMKFCRCEFRDAAMRIESVIGQARVEPPPRRKTTAEAHEAMNRLWLASEPIRPGDPVDRWFRSRGINIQVYPTSLRYAPGIPYGRTEYPAMLAMLTTPDGKPAHLHKTLFTNDGGKAPRLFAEGVIPDGAAVRLAAVTDVMGLVEGIENGFAVTQLFGIPCLAALTAPLLKKFQPPAEVKHLIICGDNDLNQVGQRAAWSLAGRLKIKVDVRIPDQPGTDWNDVLRNQIGAAA
jgi:putative DNA primase/helicase